MTRRGIRFLAPLVVAVLTVLGLTQPASAYPGWDPINWSGSTPCSDTHHVDGLNVDYQACTVASGNYMQIVAVVVNHAGTGVGVKAAVISTISGSLGVDDVCDLSTLGAGSRRGCYGATRYIPCNAEIEGWVAIEIAGVRHDVVAPSHSHC